MKLLICTILFSLIFHDLFSTDQIDIGLRFGYNNSRFIGENTPGKGVGNIPGIILGGYFSYKFTRKFELQPELLLVTKGSTINTVGDIQQYNIISYLEIPVMVKWVFITDKKIRPCVYGGSYFGIKIFAINDVGVIEDNRNIDWGLIFK